MTCQLEGRDAGHVPREGPGRMKPMYHVGLREQWQHSRERFHELGVWQRGPGFVRNQAPCGGPLFIATEYVLEFRVEHLNRAAA